jgi:hypothetical protein
MERASARAWAPGGPRSIRQRRALLVRSRSQGERLPLARSLTVARPGWASLLMGRRASVRLARRHGLGLGRAWPTRPLGRLHAR